jgi:hypothetical protein
MNRPKVRPSCQNVIQYANLAERGRGLSFIDFVSVDELVDSVPSVARFMRRDHGAGLAKEMPNVSAGSNGGGDVEHAVVVGGIADDLGRGTGTITD